VPFSCLVIAFFVMFGGSPMSERREFMLFGGLPV
jgi:hypothetical protein